MELKEKLKHLQGNMMFLSAIANGLEALVGRGATGVTFRAGRKTGLNTVVTHKESDILKALELVGNYLYKMGIRWEFEPYKKQSEVDFFASVDGEVQLKMVFKNCMVRSCQFYYGHPQKNSLCMLQHGIFCGLFQQVYGTWVDYDPIHSGENVCIGLLKIKDRSKHR